MLKARNETAAGHLVTRVPTAAGTDSAGRVLGALAGGTYDAVETVFVLDAAGRLTGVATLSDILRASPELRLSDLQRPVPCVSPATDQEAIAHLAIASGLDAVPVADSGGRFLGAVPARALLPVLQHEHEEDLVRLAGIRRGARGARGALDAPTSRRVHDRLPWLIVGVAGSLVSAWVMTRFETLLETRLAVAFFVPAIVYLADAIGTQTEAIVIRGLSVSHRPLLRLLGAEIATGAILGLVTGLLAYPVVAALGQSVRIASAVAVTLVLAGATAATSGVLLPWILSRLGGDPAFGSGPVATILQDIASLVIYLVVVTRFLA